MKPQPSYFAIIPADVRYDIDLCPNAKLLYGEITALAKREGYCYAENKYFADLYEVSRSAVSQWIGQLKRSRYIVVKIDKKKNTRKIFIKQSSKISSHDKSLLNTPLAELNTSLAELNTSLAELNTPLAELNTPLAELNTSLAELNSSSPENTAQATDLKTTKKESKSTYKSTYKSTTATEPHESHVQLVNDAKLAVAAVLISWDQNDVEKMLDRWDFLNEKELKKQMGDFGVQNPLEMERAIEATLPKLTRRNTTALFGYIAKSGILQDGIAILPTDITAGTKPSGYTPPQNIIGGKSYINC